MSSLDWESIESEYRCGIKSIREIARDHGCSDKAIRKKASQEGWVRDLTARIRQKVRIGKNIEEDLFNKPGFIYVIYIDDSNSKRYYKIGMSSSFSARFETHQCASPFDVCVACAYFVGNMRTEERDLHALFNEKRIKGEWFQLDRCDLSLIASRSLLV